jgi:hypothetical protein
MNVRKRKQLTIAFRIVGNTAKQQSSPKLFKVITQIVVNSKETDCFFLIIS